MEALPESPEEEEPELPNVYVFIGELLIAVTASEYYSKYNH